MGALSSGDTGLGFAVAPVSRLRRAASRLSRAASRRALRSASRSASKPALVVLAGRRSSPLQRGASITAQATASSCSVPEASTWAGRTTRSVRSPVRRWPAASAPTRCRISGRLAPSALVNSRTARASITLTGWQSPAGARQVNEPAILVPRWVQPPRPKARQEARQEASAGNGMRVIGIYPLIGDGARKALSAAASR